MDGGWLELLSVSIEGLRRRRRAWVRMTSVVILCVMGLALVCWALTAVWGGGTTAPSPLAGGPPTADTWGMTTATRSEAMTEMLDGLRRERAAIYASGTIIDEDDTVRAAWPVGLDAARGETLRDLVAGERASACLETGFAFGMSASFILDGMLSHGGSAAGGGPLLTSVDPFQTSHWCGAGRAHLRRAGVGKGVHELHEGGSERVLPRLLDAGRRFDFAFLDGDHRFEYVFADVLYARKLVGPGRLIVLDDAWMASVRKCAAFYELHGLCAREEPPEGAGSSKFILLRVTAEGDGRAWDHHAEF